MLTVEAVAAGYLKGSRVLEDLSFTVDRGEIVAVIGRNGMGKTTLVKTIAGHLRPEVGSITFDGRSIGADQVARLAAIDSRDVLLAKVAGAFQAPLAKGASLLGSFTRNAASMFSQLIEKKEEQ